MLRKVEALIALQSGFFISIARFLNISVKLPKFLHCFKLLLYKKKKMKIKILSIVLSALECRGTEYV